MATQFAINLHGYEALVSKFNTLSPEALNKLEKILHLVSLKIQSDAQAIVPVDTGRLKTSITARVERSDETVTAVIGPNAANQTGEIGYSSHVEFGTSRQSAQPYLQPAYDQNKDKLFTETKGLFEKV